MTTSPPVTTGLVTSRDGSTIGYRQMGRGPGLVLLHGAMQSSASFMKLGVALCDTFTVLIPDRRGRGLSAPHGEDHSIAKEVEDLDALLSATGARHVFGLSSGALITLQAALTLPAIGRIALYEPPLAIDGAPSSPLDWVPGYEKQLADGHLGGAMAVALKGTGDRELFTRLPRFVIAALMSFAIKASAKQLNGSAPSLAALIPTVRFDGRLVKEMAGTLNRFKAVQADVLLLGGDRSIAYLPRALDALGTVLPHCRRVELAGIGHLAADDTGAPERVADELRRFFLSRDVDSSAVTPPAA